MFLFVARKWKKTHLNQWNPSNSNQTKKDTYDKEVHVWAQVRSGLLIFPLKTSPPSRDTHLSWFKTTQKGNKETPLLRVDFWKDPFPGLAERLPPRYG